MGPLAAQRSGEGPTVVLAHGFTQSSSSFDPVARVLAATRTVVSVDLPGHGGSSEVSADLPGAAALLADAAAGEPFDLVGYSLGGRIALHAACAPAEGLRRVVTLSASPGIEDPAARATRLDRDVALADALDADGDVADFVERWLAAPIFSTLPRDRADVAGRSANTAAGLADSLRRCSLGTQRPLFEELSRLEVPLLMVAGAHDDPFVAHAVRVAASTLAVGAAAVPGAGHACHLEQPALVARLIDSFLTPA